jgi:hypothetical protein
MSPLVQSHTLPLASSPMIKHDKGKTAGNTQLKYKYRVHDEFKTRTWNYQENATWLINYQHKSCTHLDVANTKFQV